MFINFIDLLVVKIEIIRRLLENIKLNFGENAGTAVLKYLFVLIIILK